MKLPEVHGVKKTLDTNTLPERQKITPQIKPRLGQERAGVKCKKPKVTKNIDAATDKLQEIPRIPSAQKVAKNRTDFPMHKQSISSFKTEAIT